MSDRTESASSECRERASSRRRLLQSGVVVASAGLAGCVGVLSGGDNGSDGNVTNGTDSSGAGNQTDPDPEPSPTIESWPQYQYDAGHSGHPPGSGPTGELEVDWRFERKKKNFRCGPVVSADGTVFCGSKDGVLYALDLEDGSLLWETETEARLMTSPVLFEDLVIISEGSHLAAYDATSGERQWTNEDITGSQTPVRSGEMLVVPSNRENQLYGLYAGSGGQIWNYDVGYTMHHTPAVDDGTANVGIWGNEIHAVTLEDGTPRFTATIDEGLASGPTVVDRTIYAGGKKGGIYALDTTSLGEELWKTVPGGEVTANLAVGSEVVVSIDTQSEKSHIRGLDRQTGTHAWSQTIVDWPTSCPPVIAGGTVYCGGGYGDLHVYEAPTGTPINTLSADDFTVFGLATVRDLILVAGNESFQTLERPESAD